MAPHVFGVLSLITRRRYALCREAAAICISIELYEIVQLRSIDGVSAERNVACWREDKDSICDILLLQSLTMFNIV